MVWGCWGWGRAGGKQRGVGGPRHGATYRLGLAHGRGSMGLQASVGAHRGACGVAAFRTALAALPWEEKAGRSGIGGQRVLLGSSWGRSRGGGWGRQARRIKHEAFRRGVVGVVRILAVSRRAVNHTTSPTATSTAMGAMVRGGISHSPFSAASAACCA